MVLTDSILTVQERIYQWQQGNENNAIFNYPYFTSRQVSSRMKTPGIIVNRHLLKLARLSEAALLKRVAAVRQIRTRQMTADLFIDTAQQLKQLEQLHAAVHLEAFSAQLPGFNLAKSTVPFILTLPEPLHYWLAAHSLEEVKAQVANWMAALYASHTRRDKVWSKWRPDIRQLATAHYSPYVARQANQLIEVWTREYDQAQLRDGSSTAEVLRNPFRDNERPFLDQEDVRRSFQFEIRIGYFRRDDWVCIVERSLPKLIKLFPTRSLATNQAELKWSETDTLQRVESTPELWEAWLRTFSTVNPVPPPAASATASSY